MSKVTDALGNIQKGVNDILAVSDVLGIAVGASFFVGFIYMVFLRLFAAILTWLMIIAFNLIWVAGAGYFYLKS